MNKIYNNYLFYIFSFLPILFINESNDWGGDFSLYINQSIKFLSGDLGDLYNQQVFLSGYEKLGPYLYPMGVPLIISPVFLLFGLSFFHFKLLGIIFWFGSLYFLKKYLENFYPKELDTINLTLLTIQFSFVYYQVLDTVLSDIYFFFFFNLFLYLFSKIKDNKNVFYFIGFILFCLNIIRPTGIVITILFFSYLGYYLFKLRSAFFLTPILVFVLFYIVYIDLFSYDFGSNELNYIKQNIGFNSIIRNIGKYTVMLSEYFTGDLFKIIKNRHVIKIISTLLITSIFIYIYYYCKYKINFKATKNTLLLLALNLSILGFYILLPMTNGIRFLFPILPIIIFILIKIFPAKLAKTIILIQILTLMANNFYWNRENKIIFSNSDELIKTYDFINKNLTNDTISFVKPRVLNLFTHSNSIPHNKKSIKDSKYILYVKGISDENSELYFNNPKIIYISKNVKILKNEN